MSRLTKKVGENYCSQSGDFYDLYNKLGKLEDLLDLYGIETLVDLNVILAEYFCEMKDHTFKVKE